MGLEGQSAHSGMSSATSHFPAGGFSTMVVWQGAGVGKKLPPETCASSSSFRTLRSSLFFIFFLLSQCRERCILFRFFVFVNIFGTVRTVSCGDRCEVSGCRILFCLFSVQKKSFSGQFSHCVCVRSALDKSHCSIPFIGSKWEYLHVTVIPGASGSYPLSGIFSPPTTCSNSSSLRTFNSSDVFMGASPFKSLTFF